MYKKSKTFERDISIFKDLIGGLLTMTDMGNKRGLSRALVSASLNAMLFELRGFITREKLPAPKSWERSDVHKEKEYWTDVLSKYVTWVESQPKVSVEESPLALGVTPAMCEKFSTVGVTTIGDLLDRLKYEKGVITRLLGKNVTAVDALENKFTQAGLDPYGGRTQLATHTT